MSQLSISSLAVLVCCLALVAVGVAGLVADANSGAPTVESPALNSSETSDEGLLLDEHEEETTDRREEEYRQEVPSPGDPYFEASATDGSWVSYVNPRDEYREPYLGDGSGKICVSVYNADGQVAVGETVPNTTVSIPTGESTSWHSSADPFVVDLPLTDNYERPLDADQFGTDSDLPQGDGYLDSHCIELHGLPADGGSVSYGEATVEGEFADRVEVVGYIQQAGQAWDSDIDPLAEARSYEEAGGGWTYEPGASHGQVTVVVQIDHPQTSDDSGDDDDTDDSGEDDTDDSGEDDTDDSGEDDTDDSGDDDTDEEGTEEEESTSNTSEPTQSDDDTVSGFGIAVAVISLLAVLVLTKRR